VDPLPPLIPGLMQNLSVSIPGLIIKSCSAGQEHIHGRKIGKLLLASACSLAASALANKSATSHENRKQNLMSSQLQGLHGTGNLHENNIDLSKKNQITIKANGKMFKLQTSSNVPG